MRTTPGHSTLTRTPWGAPLETQVELLTPHGDPGVAEEVIQTAVTAEEVRHQRGDGGGIAHVERCGLGASARRRDAIGLGLRVVTVAVGEDYDRTASRELPSERRADAGSAAGDEGHSSGERPEGRSGGSAHVGNRPRPA